MTLAELVRQAYPAPEWAVFYEVSNATGAQATRRADAVALGIWPSRGYTIVGFEFKEDRRDWLREKDDPAKADVIANQCDCWWIVAGAEGVVKVEEVPALWGLYVANKERTRLHTIKATQPFPDRNKRVMLRSFAAAMLRKTMPISEARQQVMTALKAQELTVVQDPEVARLRQMVQTLQAIIDTFKAETGVDLRHGYHGPKRIAAAVRAVLELDTNQQTVRAAYQRVDAIARAMEAGLADWPVKETTP